MHRFDSNTDMLSLLRSVSLLTIAVLIRRMSGCKQLADCRPPVSCRPHASEHTVRHCDRMLSEAVKHTAQL
eukprot:8956-Heterococcus_DN1.PRE.4